MSYLTQAKLAADQTILLRASACAALEGVANPIGWAYAHAWQLSAQPGWDAAYSYALAAGSADPGSDEGAITDGMILAAVQALGATSWQNPGV